MQTDFIIKGISEESYHHLDGLNDEELLNFGVIRTRVDSYPGYPCRVSLKDARVGEEVYLLTHQHHDTDSPYRSSGPVFIRKKAKSAECGVNEIPKMLDHRLLSLRIYNRDAMMVDARTIDGRVLRDEITDAFKNQEAAYIHIHNAGPGCYNCAVYRT